LAGCGGTKQEESLALGDVRISTTDSVVVGVAVVWVVRDDVISGVAVDHVVLVGIGVVVVVGNGVLGNSRKLTNESIA
jgi:hypothetical protein